MLRYDIGGAVFAGAIPIHYIAVALSAQLLQYMASMVHLICATICVVHHACHYAMSSTVHICVVDSQLLPAVWAQRCVAHRGIPLWNCNVDVCEAPSFRRCMPACESTRRPRGCRTSFCMLQCVFILKPVPDLNSPGICHTVLFISRCADRTQRPVTVFAFAVSCPPDQTQQYHTNCLAHPISECWHCLD